MSYTTVHQTDFSNNKLAESSYVCSCMVLQGHCKLNVNKHILTFLMKQISWFFYALLFSTNTKNSWEGLFFLNFNFACHITLTWLYNLRRSLMFKGKKKQLQNNRITILFEPVKLQMWVLENLLIKFNLIMKLVAVCSKSV